MNPERPAAPPNLGAATGYFVTCDMTDRSERNSSQREGLVSAIQRLTDGVTNLVRNQVELVRIEFRREATEAGQRSGALLLFAGLALLGYGLVNLSVIFLAGWLLGFAGMTLASLLLGVVHLGVGYTHAREHVEGFQAQQERLEHKTRKLTGNQPPQLEETPES